MPTYEYVCSKCGKIIDIEATVEQKEKGLKVVCPDCGSNETLQVFGNITVIGSSKGKSGGGTPSCSCGSCS